MTVSARGADHGLLLPGPYCCPQRQKIESDAPWSWHSSSFVLSQRILVIIKCNNGYGIENGISVAVVTITNSMSTLWYKNWDSN